MDAKELIRDYARDASQIANDYYDVQRQLWAEYANVEMPGFEHSSLIDPDRALWQVQGGFSNTDYNGLTYKQAKEGRSRAGVGIDDLWPSLSNVDDAQQFIADMISASARLTTQRNIRIDPTKPRWARVPRGSKTCAFCLMLASRGFVYLSEDSAGMQMQYHEDCDCDIVPSWGSQVLKGYDPDKYLAMYQAAADAAGTGADYRTVLRQLRQMYPEDVKDGFYPLTQPWPFDEVIFPRKAVWEHIFGNHSPNSRVPGKTHFPEEWSDEKIRWAVKETVADADYTYTSNGGHKEQRYKLIDGQIIRVWLQKRHSTHGRYMINTAHPITEQQRRELWPKISK